MTRLTEIKAYGELIINGESVDLGRSEIKNIMSKIVQAIIDTSMPYENFSTLTIHLSKRPLVKSEVHDEFWDRFMAENLVHINQVHEDDLIEGTQITWGQWESLRAQPEWTNMKALTTEPDKYTETEAQSIRQAYQDKFLGTDFYGVGITL